MLVLPPLFWAGNFVVARAVHGAISPMSLSFGRWVIALACLLPFAWKPMRHDLPRYWQYRWRILAIALLGVAAFNTLIYLGLTTTTATNGLLLNAFIPILIVLMAALFYRQSLRMPQLMGMAVSFAGVLIIIAQGQWQRLAGLAFTQGDLIVFLGMVSWALYTLGLRHIPADINRVGLMGVQIIVGLVLLAPGFAWDWMQGARPALTPGSLAALAYVGVFPSVVAYLLYNLGVARVGAARAGLFIHLMPVFGPLLSAFFLGEALHLYHLAGVCAIFAGIALASRRSAA